MFLLSTLTTAIGYIQYIHQNLGGNDIFRITVLDISNYKGNCTVNLKGNFWQHFVAKFQDHTVAYE